VQASRNGRHELTLAAPEGAAIEIIRADAVSGRGFHSPGFGILQEAATVVLRAPASARRWRCSIILSPVT
jgi:hypothetical protein